MSATASTVPRSPTSPATSAAVRLRARLYYVCLCLFSLSGVRARSHPLTPTPSPNHAFASIGCTCGWAERRKAWNRLLLAELVVEAIASVIVVALVIVSDSQEELRSRSLIFCVSLLAAVVSGSYGLYASDRGWISTALVSWCFRGLLASGCRVAWPCVLGGQKSRLGDKGVQG